MAQKLLKDRIFKTGTYTGDGTTDQEIAGIGFAPRFIQIQEQETGEAGGLNIYYTSDTVIDDNAAGSCCFHDDFDCMSRIGRVKSLDADGFTVGDSSTDSHPNKNNAEYNYIAIA